jgi:hypothetical protein
MQMSQVFVGRLFKAARRFATGASADLKIGRQDAILPHVGTSSV